MKYKHCLSSPNPLLLNKQKPSEIIFSSKLSIIGESTLSSQRFHNASLCLKPRTTFDLSVQGQCCLESVACDLDTAEARVSPCFYRLRLVNPNGTSLLMRLEVELISQAMSLSQHLSWVGRTTPNCPLVRWDISHFDFSWTWLRRETTVITSRFREDLIQWVPRRATETLEQTSARPVCFEHWVSQSQGEKNS